MTAFAANSLLDTAWPTLALGAGDAPLLDGVLLQLALLASPNTPIYAAIVVGVIFIAVIAALLFHRGSDDEANRRVSTDELSASQAVTADLATPAARAPRHASGDRIKREADTDAPFDLTDPATAPLGDPQVFSPPTPMEIRSHETENPALAARMWEQLGRWPQAGACYEKAGDLERASEIWIALDKLERAIPLLRKALRDDPANEAIRIRLIETLTDLGLKGEAMELISTVSDDGPVKPSSRLYESVGRIHEALGDKQEAAKYYKLAMAKDEKLTEIPQRLVFLRHVERLLESPLDYDEQKNTAKRILDEYIEKSTKNGSSDEAVKTSVDSRTEIIVGHLALGFQHPEPWCSVRSVFSLSRRFSLHRILSEASHGAVFEAYDRLLDFPVALRLYRMKQTDEVAMNLVKARLRAIAQLNHPNLAKVSFVERDGPILILATEYLPGGNLRAFLEKLGGVGLPLLIRMAMHMTSALHTSHLRGIPHGDIRPENIIIGTDQRIKLVDFALSPIPVVASEDNSDPVASTAQTPTHITLDNMGVHSDIIQFADVLKFMLEHVRHIPPPAAGTQGDPPSTTPMEEMQELARRIRAGEFTSMLRIWQILEQIFERTLPANTETPRLSK